MNKLIKALKQFEALYKEDPEGLDSDFCLLTGHRIEELTDLLDDEITMNKEFQE